MKTQIILTTLLSLILLIGIATLLFYIVALIEKKNYVTKKYEDLRYLIYNAIGAFLLILIFLLALPYIVPDDMISAVRYGSLLLIKIAVAIWVSKEAKKLNRNPLLWFLLGFLEFHAAFIALALGKTIYKVHKDDKILFSDLESEYDEKVNSFKELNNALKKLDKESLIYKKEYKEPLAKIKHQYSIKFDEMIKKLTTSRVKEKSVEKLNRALNAGVINKDEFDMKISKL